jgi:hypothetical protein
MIKIGISTNSSVHGTIMSKKSNQIPKGRLELFVKLLESHSNVERKDIPYPYTSLNGHMITIKLMEGIVYDLSEKAR